MKLRMPEFEELNTAYMFDQYGFPYDLHVSHPYFYGRITCDGPSDNGKYFMYGFISSSAYYDDAVATSDDIELDETKKGAIKKSSVRKAYELIVKQLKERYRQWAMENIVT